MVKQFFFCILFLCSSSLPVVSQASPIKFITINETGRILDWVADDYLTKACEKFNPTAKQIKHFFMNAHPVDGYILNEDNYSPCMAYGTIKFRDNKSAEWNLYSGGVAVLTFSREEHLILYYHDYDWQDPAACIPETNNGMAC